MNVTPKTSEFGSTQNISIDVLIAIDNPHLRKGIVNTIKTQYAKCTVSEAQSLVQERNLLETQSFDVIISVAEMDRFACYEFCREIREGRLGPHPFPIIALLVGKPDPEVVRKVVDAGPDDVLLMPVAPSQVTSRLDVLGKARKAFVVTRDYTGPDRRKAPRPGAEQVPLINVPNPLGAKIQKVSELIFQREIEIMSKRLRNLKVQRYGVQLRWLAAAIAEASKGDRADGKVGTFCEQAMETIGLLDAATKTWSASTIASGSRALAGVVTAVKASETIDRALLTNLAAAAERVTAEIGRMVPN
jgi:DNA-binding response OmpR family regulator